MARCGWSFWLASLTLEELFYALDSVVFVDAASLFKTSGGQIHRFLSCAASGDIKASLQSFGYLALERARCWRAKHAVKFVHKHHLIDQVVLDRHSVLLRNLIHLIKTINHVDAVAIIRHHAPHGCTKRLIDVLAFQINVFAHSRLKVIKRISRFAVLGVSRAVFRKLIFERLVQVVAQSFDDTLSLSSQRILLPLAITDLRVDKPLGGVDTIGIRSVYIAQSL